MSSVKEVLSKGVGDDRERNAMNHNKPVLQNTAETTMHDHIPQWANSFDRSVLLHETQSLVQELYLYLSGDWLRYAIWKSEDYNSQWTVNGRFRMCFTLWKNFHLLFTDVFLVFMLRHKILKSKFNRPAKLLISLGVR